MSFSKKPYLALLCIFLFAALVALSLPRRAVSRELGSVVIPERRARGVTVVEDLAYVGSRKYAGGGTMAIVDVSNPTHPDILGTLSKQDQVQDVLVAGNYAYYADNGCGLGIVDVSNPRNPVRVAGVANLGEAIGIALSMNYAYIAGYKTDVTGEGLSTIDIADPLRPKLVGKLSALDFLDVDISGNFAYVVSRRGLHVVDVTDKANPTEIAFIALDGGASRIDVVGSLAYLARAGAGLTIVDISNPMLPEVLGNLSIVNCLDVDVEGDIATTAEGESGFAVVNVSDPASPTLMYVVDTPGNATRLDIANGLVYVADEDALRIFEVPELAITVKIDIKPGSWPNSINPDSKGVIPVAILTTSTAVGESVDFDATTVDPSSVKFGPNEALAVQSAIEDVDQDSDLDIILHFKTQETGIQAGDTEACLTGKTTDGQEIEGCDAVRTVPPKGKKGKAAPALLAFAAPPAYPQPCNPETWIPFKLGQGVEVTITIYNSTGRIIRTLNLGHQEAGAYTSRSRAAYWNGRNECGERVSSGIYFYTLKAGSFIATRKMVVVR